MAHPDVIVVGSGSAGAVAARRLVDAARACCCWRPAARTSTRPSTTPGARTSCGCRRRTGPSRPCPRPRRRSPAGLAARPGARRLELPQRAVWVRGAAADFDHWAYLGNPGWRGTTCARLRADGAPRPAQGLATTTSSTPIHRSIVDGRRTLGIPFNDELQRRRAGRRLLDAPDDQATAAGRAAAWPTSSRSWARTRLHARHRRARAAAAPRRRALPRRRVDARRRAARARPPSRGDRLRGHDPVAAAADALRHRAGRAPRRARRHAAGATCPGVGPTCTTTCSRR